MIPGKEAAMRLKDKVALVTGASKNIGKGIALEVGASGAVTYLSARTVEERIEAPEVAIGTTRPSSIATRT